LCPPAHICKCCQGLLTLSYKTFCHDVIATCTSRRPLASVLDPSLPNMDPSLRYTENLLGPNDSIKTLRLAMGHVCTRFSLSHSVVSHCPHLATSAGPSSLAGRCRSIKVNMRASRQPAPTCRCFYTRAREISGILCLHQVLNSLRFPSESFEL
jgi:hypothetical protein